jgi:hypothetical protein
MQLEIYDNAVEVRDADCVTFWVNRGSPPPKAPEAPRHSMSTVMSLFPSALGLCVKVTFPAVWE